MGDNTTNDKQLREQQTNQELQQILIELQIELSNVKSSLDNTDLFVLNQQPNTQTEIMFPEEIYNTPNQKSHKQSIKMEDISKNYPSLKRQLSLIVNKLKNELQDAETKKNHTEKLLATEKQETTKEASKLLLYLRELANNQPILADTTEQKQQEQKHIILTNIYHEIYIKLLTENIDSSNIKNIYDCLNIYIKKLEQLNLKTTNDILKNLSNLKKRIEDSTTQLQATLQKQSQEVQQKKQELEKFKEIQEHFTTNQSTEYLTTPGILLKIQQSLLNPTTQQEYRDLIKEIKDYLIGIQVRATWLLNMFPEKQDQSNNSSVTRNLPQLIQQIDDIVSKLNKNYQKPANMLSTSFKQLEQLGQEFTKITGNLSVPSQDKTQHRPPLVSLPSNQKKLHQNSFPVINVSSKTNKKKIQNR